MSRADLVIAAVVLASILLLFLEVERNRSQFSSPEAIRKGEELLISNLTPAQRRDFEKSGYFDVVGSSTRTNYRIRKGRFRNVFEIKTRRKRGLCFAPTGDLVAGDCMLAQKIALENFEDEVLRTANFFDA